MNSVFVVTILTIASAVHAKELPIKFYGKYDLDHSENFDEYLAAKVEFDYANLTSKKDVFYKDVEMGKEFIGEGIDSTKHKITFDVVGDVLHEKHIPIEKGEFKAETYEYSFTTKDGKEYLLVKMEANGVVGKRFYRRV